MTRRNQFLFAVVVAPWLVGLGGCGGGGSGDDTVDPPDAVVHSTPDAPPSTCQPVAMRADLEWYGTNRDTLIGWLDAAGCASAGYDPAHRPLALFDWDNTTIKNDVGDAITFWMIDNDKVVQPPGQDWHATSPFMTDAAATALTLACGVTVAAGEPLPTSTDLGCADEMLSIYVDGVTTGGLDAFAGWDYRKVEPTYAWTAQLLAGYTHAEIGQFTLSAITPMLAAAEGTTQTVGTSTQNGWLRVYDQTKDLILAAQTRGYDVWIVSASPQDVVAAFAPMAGVAADHVVGIRSLTDGAGKLTYGFEGCGPIADNADAIIPYIEGKRCWINKAIYGDTSPSAINRRPAGQRQWFSAGDSDTDVEFLRDSTYRFLLNRNKKELMCFAYYDDNGANTWLINPMFIGGKPMAAPYPCSTSACKRSDGTAGACHEDGGGVIPDQDDQVFVP